MATIASGRATLDILISSDHQALSKCSPISSKDRALEKNHTSSGASDAGGTNRSSVDDVTENVNILENTQNAERLPPEKQLAKLKRFLQTIFRFAEDFTPDKREKVKQLIFDVVSDKITAQEFYSQLHGSTKFPLRPYVVPFLESSLPVLRTSLKWPVSSSWLEKELFGTSDSPVAVCQNTVDLYRKNHAFKLVSAFDNNFERKRRMTLTSYERMAHSPSPAKRAHYSNMVTGLQQTQGSAPPPNVYPQLLVDTVVNGGVTTPARVLYPPQSNGISNAATTVGMPSIATTSALTSTVKIGGAGSMGALTPCPSENVLASTNAQRPDLNPSTPATLVQNGTATGDWWTWQTDEWRSIESLFTTMVTTMERLRYGLLLFQQRTRLTQLWNEKFQQHQRLHDSNLKIEEMQRRADAAVQEVKRAAVTELQKAVQAAEQKALHMIATERAQMEKLLRDTQLQEESMETCWNCGRRAGQTCSGCGRARYCGVFCQHKDWHRHRAACAGVNANGSIDSPEEHSSPMLAISVKSEYPVLDASGKQRVSPKSI